MSRVAFLVVITAARAQAQTAPSIEANGLDVTINARRSVIIAAEDLVLQKNPNEATLNVANTMGTMMSQMNEMSDAINGMNSQMTAMSTSVASQISEIQNSLAATDSRARAADQSGDISDLQDQINAAVAAATAADHTQIISTLNATVYDQINITATGFASFEARMTELEDHYWNTTANTSLFLNGDFEDDNGQASHIDGYSFVYPNTEDAIQLISLDEDDKPPTVHFGKTLNYALRIGPGTCNQPGNEECFVEYRLQTDQQRNSKLCRGSYTFSAWARRSSDWAGRDMLFHHRWMPYGISNWNQANSMSQSWGTPQGGGVEIGAFPRGTQWQRIEVTTRLNRDAQRMFLFLAYPWLSSRGHVDVTGLDVRRIGGPGNC